MTLRDETSPMAAVRPGYALVATLASLGLLVAMCPAASAEGNRAEAAGKAAYADSVAARLAHVSSSPSAEMRAGRQLTAVAVEGNVGGKPLARSRVSVTTPKGKELLVVGGAVRTDATGLAALYVRGRPSDFVVSLSGGRYGYNRDDARPLRGSVRGFGRSSGIATIASPETSVAVAEYRSNGSRSIRTAVKSTQRFLHLAPTGSPFDLGHVTGTQSSAWPAKRFLRMAARAGGPQAFAQSVTDRVGKKGQEIWPRSVQARLDSSGNALTKAIFKGMLGMFTGGIGNLLNSGLCAINGVLPAGYDVVMSLFTGCDVGGGGADPEVSKKLDDIQSSVNQLSDEVKDVNKKVSAQAFHAALAKSKLEPLNDQLKVTNAAVKVLATAPAQVPSGTESRGISADALCDKAYPGRTDVGQSAYRACLRLHDAYELFTRQSPSAANELYHALGDITPGSNVIATLQDALRAGNQFIDGGAQRRLMQFYLGALSSQQTAFIYAAAWARMYEAWTGASPTSCTAAPSSYRFDRFTRNLDTSCELAATGLYDLSVELAILDNGPETIVDNDVLVDPTTGFSWWRYAFDGSGATLRTDNPASPFFDQPYGGWSNDALAERVYGSVTGRPNREFDLPGGGEQKFQIPTKDQSLGLVADVRKLEDPKASVATLLGKAGFKGPGSTVANQGKGAWGMDWTRFGLDFGQREYPLSFTYAGDHYWGSYLNDSDIAGEPCDTRTGHAEVTDGKYLWPHQGNSFTCTFKDWGAYIASDFRYLANSVLRGVWATRTDQNEECPRRVTRMNKNNTSEESVCTEDTFGLLVSPENVLWSESNFLLEPDEVIDALVMPPFAQLLPQTKGQETLRGVNYRVSGSQNVPDESAEVWLQCASNRTFTSAATTRKLPDSRPGPDLQEKQISLAPNEVHGWCRIKASNRGGETISEAVQTK